MASKCEHEARSINANDYMTQQQQQKWFNYANREIARYGETASCMCIGCVERMKIEGFTVTA